MHLLVDNLDKIDWTNLCLNTHPIAIKMIEKRLIENQDQFYLYVLSENPNAINIMINNPELFNINHFMRNSNGFSFLEKHMNNNINLETIMSSLSNLLYNPNNIQIINKMWKLGRISERTVSSIINESFNISRSVFDLDYQKMSKIRSKILYPELVANVFHPTKVEKLLDYHLQNNKKLEDFDL